MFALLFAGAAFAQTQEDKHHLVIDENFVNKIAQESSVVKASTDGINVLTVSNATTMGIDLRLTKDYIMFEAEAKSGSSVTYKVIIEDTLFIENKSRVDASGAIDAMTIVMNDGDLVTMGGTRFGGDVIINGGRTKFGKTTRSTANVIVSNVVIDVKYLNVLNSGKLIVEPTGGVVGYLNENLELRRNIRSREWDFIGMPNQEDFNILATDGLPGVWAVAFNPEYIGTDRYGDTYVGGWWIDDNDGNSSNDPYNYITNPNQQLQRGVGVFIWAQEGFQIAMDGAAFDENVTVAAPQPAGNGEISEYRALSNPYAAPISVDDFVLANNPQGDGVYVNDEYGMDFVGLGMQLECVIHVAEGFMAVAANSTASMQFTPSMIQSPLAVTSTAGSGNAKSAIAKRDFLKVSVVSENYTAPIYFAKNEAASVEFDRFDAYKIFGFNAIVEPYLVSNGKELVKEEVDVLPYTTTMNIRAFEAQTVDIVADNIPEEYTLTLIDNGERVELTEGERYTVNIASGENADRFKLLIGKNNVSIQDIRTVEELVVRSYNRDIVIEGAADVMVEVYNALGQKVYQTNQPNFTLEGVAAGAYVLKVQSGALTHSSKIIVQ